MSDKTHPERESNIEWYGSVFESAKVDLDERNQQLANLMEYVLDIERA